MSRRPGRKLNFKSRREGACSDSSRAVEDAHSIYCRAAVEVANSFSSRAVDGEHSVYFCAAVKVVSSIYCRAAVEVAHSISSRVVESVHSISCRAIEVASSSFKSLRHECGRRDPHLHRTVAIFIFFEPSRSSSSHRRDFIFFEPLLSSSSRRRDFHLFRAIALIFIASS